MKKLLALTLAVVMMMLTLSGCEQASEKKEYILASLPNDGGEMTQNTGFVIAEMNKALKPYNASVKYVTADDYSVVSESVLSGTANIGTPSGATYTKAHLENPNVIPMFVATPEGDLTKGGYPAYIATHIDNKGDFDGMSEDEALASLKGKSFSFVSATSTSGRLVPTTTLWNIFGPDGTGDVENRNQIFELTTDDGGLFEEVQFGGNHPGSVELIANKKVYAGAFCCDYAADRADDIYIISEKTVPPGPYWVNTEYMDQEHVDAIINHFVALTPETAEPGMFVGDGGESDESFGVNDRFVKVDPSFYGFLEEMYKGEE